MKHFLTAALLAAPLFASAQKLPQPSPTGKVEQIIGLTTVKVEYSRPSMKGRAIFGDLVPYGEVWRTGANKCTTIEFDDVVMIEGSPVKPGKYSLFTIPSEDTWVLLLNSNVELWGADERKPEEDVLTVKVQRGKVAEAAETFTIGFDRVMDDKAVLFLEWEHMRVEVSLFADATEKALANIKEALSKTDAKYNNYNSSARFCVDRNLMLPQALEWAEKSVSMEKKYWNTYTLALARAANGKSKEAIEAANESMKLAQEAKDANYVKMCRDRISEWTTPAGSARPTMKGK
ncbi:MAG: DUF2911 domain-containing protein [Flavobacteriales bacterium]|nr:DUF2911 domain-containing protein [Flavobacteriales bacterium]